MEAAQTSRRSLGELFVERGLISQSDLELALEEQAATKRRLADILVQRGLVTGRDITSALMEQLGSAAPAQAGPVAEGAPAPDDVPSPESTADVIVLPQPAFAAVAEPEVTQSLAGDEFDLTPGSDPAPTPSAAAPEGLPVPGHDLIAEADARCRNAEADLSAARESHARVLRELEQVRTDLDAQEQELARQVANWQDARDETERWGGRLAELQTRLEETDQELSEASATAAAWAARASELGSDAEALAGTVESALEELDSLIAMRFPAGRTDPPVDADTVDADTVEVSTGEADPADGQSQARVLY